MPVHWLFCNLRLSNWRREASFYHFFLHYRQYHIPFLKKIVILVFKCCAFSSFRSEFEQQKEKIPNKPELNICPTGFNCSRLKWFTVRSQWDEARPITERYFRNPCRKHFSSFYCAKWQMPAQLASASQWVFSLKISLISLAAGLKHDPGLFCL